MTKSYNGKCLCGDVTYTAKGPPVIVAQCHCEQCRRLSGTGHTVGAMFPARAVDVQGKLNAFSYPSGQGSIVTRASCTNCASPIYGTNTNAPDYITITLGTLDDAIGLSIEVVIFAQDKRHWDELDEGVPKFATQPDWSPPT